MDTFMDKLAQKLNAQEMIKANAAADAAELSRFKEQNAEYEALLQQIKDSSGQNAENAEKLAQNAEKIGQSAALVGQNAAKLEQGLETTRQSAAQIEQAAIKVEQGAVKVEQGAEKAEQNAAKIESLVAACIAKIEEMQAASRDTEELNAQLGEFKKILTEQMEQLTDHVHKEDVKVYRNVQAVVVDETAKQSDILGKSLASMSGSLKVVTGISVAALLAAVAGIAFQVLVYLHII